MNAWYDYALGWFADYYLLSTLLLAVVMLVGNLMRQPARRLVLAWATVGNLALLGVLLAVPGWSVVHLLGTPPPRPEPIVWAPEASSNLPNTPVVDGPVQPLPLHTSPALRPFPDLQTPQSGSPTPIALAASAEIREVNLSPYILAPFVLGSTIMLLWLALGAWQSFRMVRGSVPSPPEVASLLSALCDAGDRLPHLRLSQWVATGVALGLIRPMILLPQQYADRQDAEGLRLVLAHELAHLRRGDLWMLAAIRCLMVVLWAHPLYWWFRRRVRLDQETLADAAAAELTSRTDYAEQLVGWARQLDNVHPPTLAGAVGLWETKSQLRRRIAVLLDERLTILRHSSRKWKLVALVLCGTVALGLSLLTVEPGKGLAEETAAGDAASTEVASDDQSTETATTAAAIEWPAELTGKIVDEQGGPIVGAQLKFRLQKIHEYTVGRWDEIIAVLEAETDDEGQYKFDVSSLPKLTHRPFNIELNAKADGFADARTWSWHTIRDTKVSETPFSPLVMLPGQAVAGRVVDPSGNPVSGAVLKVVADYGHHWNQDPVSTDQNGRFELTLAKGKHGAMWIVSPDWAPQYVDLAADNPDMGEISLAEGAIVAGTVRDKAGKPIEGCVVVARSCDDGNLKGLSFPVQFATLTDQQGRYQLPPSRGKFKLYLSDADRTNERLDDEFVVGRVAAPLVTPQIVDLAPPVSAVKIDFKEAEAIQLSGTVRWNDGQPAANCEVKLSFMPSDMGFGTGIWLGETVTDEAGKYTLSVAKGTDSLHLSCYGSRDANGVWKVAYPSRRLTDDPTGQYFQLEEPFEQDLSGIDWVLLGEGEEEQLSDDLEDDTSETLEGKSSATSTVTATLTRTGGQLGEGTANFRFEQERTPNAVDGVCFTPDGQPADGVTVSLYRSRQQSGDFQLLDVLQTGADGRFQFADILPKDEVATAAQDWSDEIYRGEADNYTLVVSKAGSVTRYATAAKPAIAAGVSARITLEPSATLTGVVTDPDSKPVEGAQVSASRGVTAALPPGIHSARTDAQGRYTIDDAAPFDREEYERTMAAGDDSMWLSFFAAVEPSVGESRNTEPPVLSVSHPDFALKRVAYDAIPGTANVELDLPAVIVGRVVDVDGKPLAGKQVRAFTGLEQPLDSDAVYKQFILMAETDSQGRYHFDQSPAGVYELQMVTVAPALPESLPRGVTDFEVKSGEEHTAPDIQLERGGLVDLQLTDTETKKPIVFEPGAGASVNIETLGAGRLEGNRYFRTTLGEDGKLKIRCLTGTAKISVLQAGTPFDQKTNVAPEWQGVYEYENAPQVDVIGDETVKLEIEMKSRELENRISAMMQSAFKLANEDKPDLAAEELNEAIDLAKGQQLASILVMRSRFWEQAGQYDKAIADFERVLGMDPVPRGVGTLAQVQLSTLLVECEDQSLRDYARAIELGEPAIAKTEAMTRGLPVQPEITKAYEALAKAYEATGEPDKASELRQRLAKLEGSNGGQALKRKFAEATNLELSGHHVAAAKQFEQIIAHEAAQQSGVKTLAKNNLAYLLAASPNESVRDGKRAVELATQAIEESALPNGQLQDTLAAAYAEIGDFEKAVATQQRAVEQASPTAKREMQERLELYKAGKPYRLESHPQKVENRQGATEKSELNDSNATYSANVVDAETGKPIKEFLVLPGTSRMEGYGWQWQDHLLTSFEDGQLVWPPRGKRPYQSQAIRIEAEGYVPYETEEILSDAPRRGQTIRLQPSKGVAGRLMDVDGKPVAGATVAIGMCGRTVRIDDGKIVLRQLSADASLRTRWGQPRSTTTAEDGAFTLPDESAPAVFIATHPEGVAILSWEWVRQHRQVHLEPWGRIEGQVLWGQTPGAEESILMSARGHRDPEGLDIMLMLSCSDGVVSDKEGRFLFDKVPPGLVQVSRDSKPAGASKIRTLRPVQFVDVLPGGPTEMIFGGGRPVVGKLVGRDSWKDVYLNIATDAPSMSGLVDMVKEDWKAYSDFNSSEAGKHYSKQSVKVDADGSFRIEGVPPERYDVRIVQQRADGDAARIGYSTFRMETITPGEEGTPLDVGEIEVAAAPQ